MEFGGEGIAHQTQGWGWMRRAAGRGERDGGVGEVVVDLGAQFEGEEVERAEGAGGGVRG